MYLTKILKLYKFFHLFAIFRTKCNGLAAIGNDFILLDDNARFCRAVLVEDYLESVGFGANGMASSISRSQFDKICLELP